MTTFSLLSYNGIINTKSLTLITPFLNHIYTFVTLNLIIHCANFFHTCPLLYASGENRSLNNKMSFQKWWQLLKRTSAWENDQRPTTWMDACIDLDVLHNLLHALFYSCRLQSGDINLKNQVKRKYMVFGKYCPFPSFLDRILIISSIVSNSAQKILY